MELCTLRLVSTKGRIMVLGNLTPEREKTLLDEIQYWKVKYYEEVKSRNELAVLVGIRPREP